MLMDCPWLCYSPSLYKAYCESCWLFSDRSHSHFRTEWIDGIKTWKNLSQKLRLHEKSVCHIQAMMSRTQLINSQTIDRELQLQISDEASYWRRVQQRIFKTILSLVSGGNTVRGHDESIQSSNPGNFAEFDLIMKELLHDEKN